MTGLPTPQPCQSAPFNPPLRRLVLTAIGTMVFIGHNTLNNKSGTTSICCQMMALKFVNKKRVIVH